MAKFRVKYFGSNDVPVDLIKPILDEIDAELVIARPTTDAEIIEAGRDPDGSIMHGAASPSPRKSSPSSKKPKSFSAPASASTGWASRPPGDTGEKSGNPA